MYANAKVREVLTSILERFKSGDIPKAIAFSIFPIPDIPSAKWSLCNRTLMFFAGTQDARGFQQWKEAKRYVKKGAKSFSILAPSFKKKENGEGEEEVFAYSTGNQYSAEDPAWGNGAFTKAVLEGINGKADFTGKGRITINMLDLYISERVKELTKGKQTPTTTKPQTVPDFPIAVIRRGG